MTPVNAPGSLAVADHHVALAESVRGWAARHVRPAVPRSYLEVDGDFLPPFWAELAEQGWLAIHVGEDAGGDGYGLEELSIVLEELGRAAAPGPFLPTVTAFAVLDRFGAESLRTGLLRSTIRDARPAAVAFSSVPGEVEVAAGSLHLAGTWTTVLGGALADVFLLPVRADGAERWVAVERDGTRVTITERPSVDHTRRVADVTVSGLTVDAQGDRVLDVSHAAVRDMAAVLAAAECVGGAAWCVSTAAEHATVREQFGRPIGQFQGVKHRCADMLCALEQARAATWDATRGGVAADEHALAAAVAAALAIEAFHRCAKDGIQVLGGIGFTWEHDAHIYLKRAMSLRSLLGGGRPWRARAMALAKAGVRRDAHIDVGAVTSGVDRDEVRAFLDDLRAHDKSEWRRLIADAGYIAPHWPRPWGRDASPVEQIVIDEEFKAAHVRRPHLQVGAWVLPTLVAHGTEVQQERFIPPTLRGELQWCQLFSEPGAGSDLAGLSTKASRTDGGWLLTGQKVWTTMAKTSDWGICLARTNPTVAKHDGITSFLVDMNSAGIDIRPLRELTGEAMFNEVFLSDVFVPDDCVVGDVDDGWKTARTTLENERVSMGSGSSFGYGVEALLALVDRADADEAAVDEVAALLVTAQSLAMLGVRLTLRALSGAVPGPESSVRKLLGVEHDQRVQEIGLSLLGPAGAVVDGEAAMWVNGFLANRCLTIAGGTSEIQRNVIAERLLGLPKD